MVGGCPIRDAIGTQPVCPRRPVGWAPGRPRGRGPRPPPPLRATGRDHWPDRRWDRRTSTDGGEHARPERHGRHRHRGWIGDRTGQRPTAGRRRGVGRPWSTSTGQPRSRLRHPSGGVGLQADVGRPESWPGILDAVTDRFGGIDLVHLNAGVMTGEADITALSDEAYRRIMSVNVDGVVYGVRATVPALARPGAAGPSWPPRRWPGSSASRPTRCTA